MQKNPVCNGPARGLDDKSYVRRAVKDQSIDGPADFPDVDAVDRADEAYVGCFIQAFLANSTGQCRRTRAAHLSRTFHMLLAPEFNEIK